MIIGFHSNQISERGVDVAMYDYAYFHKKRGYQSIILFKEIYNQKAVQKFQKQFKCIQYQNWSDIDKIIEENHIDYFYSAEAGDCYDKVVTKCPNLIHAVFNIHPHGEKYAAISDWLAAGKVPSIPYMINLPIVINPLEIRNKIRTNLNIPLNAIVLGRHGGYIEFDIHYVMKAVAEEDNIYFLLVNTRPFCNKKNVIFLSAIIDLEEKVKFINACDGMIHARTQGETFGLAIGEFSSQNKPIITCKGREDNAHLDILKDKGIYYKNYEDVKNIFANIKDIIHSRQDWNAFTEYTPEKVMTKFYDVFIPDRKIINSTEYTTEKVYNSLISAENIN